MESRPVHVDKLSSKLKTMKFMRKTEGSGLKNKDANLNSKLNSEEHWYMEYTPQELTMFGGTIENKKKIPTISTGSYLNVEKTGNELLTSKQVNEKGVFDRETIGRRSFKEFNSDIEKIEKESIEKVKEEISKEQIKKVSTSDKEMSSFYAKKRSKKR
ncbi:hypothetical protein BB558_004734 [Smittium angustum]|uniref:M-phase phosphoprotein 6 n=1 Tax=Smittium angustum TaxID=133377 RepID=A0A2U1J2L9_SMIAN|nr:hypothetical protein BB558_004734 [Smittium angustum]